MFDLTNLIGDNSARHCLKAKLPPLERGTQSYRFNVGDQTVTTDLAVYKAGYPVKIVERYKENGYCYYVDAEGRTHRDKDLK